MFYEQNTIRLQNLMNTKNSLLGAVHITFLSQKNIHLCSEAFTTEFYSGSLLSSLDSIQRSGVEGVLVLLTKCLEPSFWFDWNFKSN